MNNGGYVYVLINPMMDGVVKIGKTNRHPSLRAKELSAATGVPMPFLLAFDAYFEDCTAAEEYAHELLKQRGYRISENKEFFRVPVNEAIKVIIDAQKHFESGTPSLSRETPKTVASTCSDKVVQTLLSEAQATLDGTGEVLRNPRKALQLYKQASRLGSAEAFLGMGHAYLSLGGHSALIDRTDPLYKLSAKLKINTKRRGSEEQLGKARECFEEAGNRGAGLGWAMLAQIESESNAQKAWQKYCRSPQRGNAREQCDHCLKYLIRVKKWNLPLEENPVPSSIKELLPQILTEKIAEIENKESWNDAKAYKSYDLTLWSNYRVLLHELAQRILDSADVDHAISLAPWADWEEHNWGAEVKIWHSKEFHRISARRTADPPFSVQHGFMVGPRYEIINANNYVEALHWFLLEAVLPAVMSGQTVEAILAKRTPSSSLETGQNEA